MNKPHSRILLLGALIMIALTTACQKDGVVTLKAKMGRFSNQDKVYIGGQQNRTPYWQNGDTAIVNGLPYQLALTTAEGARLEVPSAPAYWALFPASIYTSTSNADNRINISLPALQPYYTAAGQQAVNAPMGAYLGGEGSSTLTFTNLGALLAITITNNTGTPLTVDSVTVQASGVPLWGEGYISDYATDDRRIVLTSSLDGHNTVVLARPGADPTISRSASMNLTVSTVSEPVYVYVPACELTPNRFTITVHTTSPGGNATSFTHAQTNPSGGSIPLNSLAGVSFPMGEAVIPTGAISGKFTIGLNADGTPKQVYFSQGNLQYQASTGIFRFAEHQYDWVGGNTSVGNVFEGGVRCSNNNISHTYSGWIDLFGWGTSGVSTYYPYLSFNVCTSYPNVPSFTDDNAIYDWGYSNPISNGGNQAGQWRTLTQPEWNYLLNSRTFDNQATHKGVGYSFKYVTLQVSSELSVTGLLIFPDGYSGQSNIPATPVTISSIPDECVFLPSRGGYRSGTSEPTQPAQGFYWTASRYTTQRTTVNVYRLNIQQTSLNLGGQMSYCGMSVRLVQDAH